MKHCDDYDCQTVIIFTVCKYMSGDMPLGILIAFTAHLMVDYAINRCYGWTSFEHASIRAHYLLMAVINTIIINVRICLHYQSLFEEISKRLLMRLIVSVPFIALNK